jgi:hypothetical protein
VTVDALHDEVPLRGDHVTVFFAAFALAAVIPHVGVLLIYADKFLDGELPMLLAH